MVHLLCPPSLRSSMTGLAPRCERTSGHRLTIDWQLMPPMKRLIDAGAAFDVAILTPELIDDAITRGAILAHSRTPFARTGIGVAVRRGARLPDIATVDAFARALCAARSIAYTGDGAAGNAVLAMLERLGLTAVLAPKLQPMPGGGAVLPVARGEVEIALTTIPGILEIEGAALAGPLPAELQSWVVYVAGVGAKSCDAATGAALISFLTTAQARAVLAAKGVEPISPAPPS